MRQEYVTVARAKGLRERVVIYRHALKNAAVPILTVSGIETAYLLGGAILTESVFGFQGIGLWLLSAVKARDYAVIQVGDGTIGWTEFAPYDRILVTAGAPNVPKSLVEQLADPGVMVIPVGTQGFQDLKVVTKRDGQTSARSGGGCVFVPLLGKEGWRREGQ